MRGRDVGRQLGLADFVFLTPTFGRRDDRARRLRLQIVIDLY